MAEKAEKLDEEAKKHLDDAIELMQEVIDDRSVPRNIRAAIDEAKQKVSSKKDLGVSIGSAIYLLDDISNDINMPSHTRTEIWTISSSLEAAKEKLK